MSVSKNEIQEELNEWLSAHAVELFDVMHDEQGYYVFGEDESEAGVEFEVKEVKVYLPAKFQHLNLCD